MMRGAALLLSVTMCGAVLAQQPIGSVGVGDATVTGALQVTNGRALLVGNTTVRAKDHTAEVALDRGGSVRVCATSGLHLTAGKSASGSTPLMLALDRGAIEIKMPATTSDVLMTPDLRFAMRSAGPLDLRIRVAPNGDTCVENRGEKAPTLGIADQFGQASYELSADQHVLFEHGSLKEVVDHESSPCGCPPEPVVSVADAGVTSATPAAPGSAVSPSAADDQHPFPAAVSEGMAPAAQVPQSPPGVVHAQVTTTMSYSAAEGSHPPEGAGASASTSVGAGKSDTAGNQSSTAAAAQTTPAADVAQAPPPPPAPSPGNLFHSIGHFFKRLFGRG